MTAGDRQPTVAPAASERVLVAATTALLFVAPFASSAGLRGAFLLIATVALVLAARTRGWRAFGAPDRVVVIAFAAWCVLAVASLAWTERPEYSRGALRADFFYSALAFWVFYFAAQGPGRWAPWRFALLGGTFAVLASQFLEEAGGLHLWRNAPDGGPGAFSTHLVLMAPMVLALGWEPPWGSSRRRTLVLASALALLFAGAWITGNRIVWAAFVAQVAAMLATARAMHFSERQHARRWTRAAAVAGIAMAVACAVALVRHKERFYADDPSMTASFERDVRPRLWEAAQRSFLEAPWFGHGFGREIAAAEFLPLSPPGPHELRFTHAHNVFVDLALQLGVVGLAAFVALIAAVLLEYRRYLRDPALAPLGVMGIALVIGFLVKNLTDDFLQRQNALVFWAINGMLLGLGRARSKPAPPP